MHVHVHREVILTSGNGAAADARAALEGAAHTGHMCIYPCTHAYPHAALEGAAHTGRGPFAGGGVLDLEASTYRVLT